MPMQQNQNIFYFPKQSVPAVFDLCKCFYIIENHFWHFDFVCSRSKWCKSFEKLKMFSRNAICREASNVELCFQFSNSLQCTFSFEACFLLHSACFVHLFVHFATTSGGSKMVFFPSVWDAIQALINHCLFRIKSGMPNKLQHAISSFQFPGVSTSPFFLWLFARGGSLINSKRHLLSQKLFVGKTIGIVK